MVSSKKTDAQCKCAHDFLKIFRHALKMPFPRNNPFFPYWDKKKKTAPYQPNHGRENPHLGFYFLCCNLTVEGGGCLCVLDNGGLQTLGLLDVDGLDVAIQLLLGALLVVTLAGDADAQTEGDALDAGLPDLLVQKGVKADILGALLFGKLATH